MFWRLHRGAVVKIDGEIIIDEPAKAHCFGGIGISGSEVYNRILKHIGYEVKVTDTYNAE